MTKEEYRELRKRIGSQQEVAKLLKLGWNTLSRREQGTAPINEEAELAMVHLVKCLYVLPRQRRQ